MIRSMSLIGVIAATMIASCVAGDDTEQTTKADQPEQKTAGYGYWTWQRSTNLPTSDNYHSIGSTSNQTCFLGGLWGSMYSDPDGQEGSGLDTYAEAGVNVSGSTYQIEAFSGATGWGIGSRVICTDTVASRSNEFYFDTDASPGAVKMVATTNPKTGKATICGLTKIAESESAFGWLDPQDFASVTDEIHIAAEDDGYWYLEGNGHAAGYAQCIDVDARTALSVADYSVDGGTINLSQGPDKQCYLTGLKGVFQKDNLSSGVWIDYNADSLQWTMTATDAGKQRGYARCLE